MASLAVPIVIGTPASQGQCAVSASGRKWSDPDCRQYVLVLAHGLHRFKEFEIIEIGEICEISGIKLRKICVEDWPADCADLKNLRS